MPGFFLFGNRAKVLARLGTRVEGSARDRRTGSKGEALREVVPFNNLAYVGDESRDRYFCEAKTESGRFLA